MAGNVVTLLFEPRLLERTAATARFELPLEPREPYLDHHRPGGKPLLATVLGIEALAAAAHLVEPGDARISDVRVGAPLLPAGDAPAPVLIDLRSDGPGGGLLCRLSSTGPHGERLEHLAARLLPAVAGTRAASTPRPVELDSNAALPGERIYAELFHGPAFRVIRMARWCNGELHAEFNRHLPPLRGTTHRRTHSAPLLVEFGLQAAGLLELARSGRMMIPCGIASIHRESTLDESAPTGLRAWARPTAPGSDTVDVEIRTGRGDCVMSIRGYRTVPLPFAADEAGLEQLRTALLDSRSAAPQGDFQA